MMESVRTGAHPNSETEREFQILGAATLKLRMPDEVRTNGTDRQETISVRESEKSHEPRRVTICATGRLDYRRTARTAQAINC